MKITKRQLRKIIAEEIQSQEDDRIVEGWLDKLKAKAYGKSHAIDKKIKKALKKGAADEAGETDEEYEQGMKELHFAGNAKKNFANRLEKMAQEMENDTKDMGFDENEYAYKALAQIPVILRKAAEEIGNVNKIASEQQGMLEF